MLGDNTVVKADFKGNRVQAVYSVNMNMQQNNISENNFEQCIKVLQSVQFILSG